MRPSKKAVIRSTFGSGIKATLKN